MHMNIKNTLGLACVLAILSGCVSTDSQDTAGTDTGSDSGAVSTGTADQSGVSARDNVADQEPEQEALETVFYFEFDKAVLRPEARDALVAHAERLKDNPQSVRLEGHADERGTREYNMALGERRANAVRRFLELQGVDSSLLETISYGEERPAARGSNESAWEKNRRVELEVE